MPFHSSAFAVLLVITFFAYWLAVLSRRPSLRPLSTVVLLLSSALFYASWNRWYLLLILGSTTLDYGIALGLERSRVRRRRRLLLFASIAGNLGLLGSFKYADFVMGNVSQAVQGLGGNMVWTSLGWVLPVGISFYTFQTLSYTIDVYWGHLPASRSFVRFATYVSFFPQLVAGPIVRASELLPQLDHPKKRIAVHRFGQGVFLILKGLVKKVVLADTLASELVDRVWNDPAAFSNAEMWLALFGYAFQIYADFSGYTDVARGAARVLGFELPINFHRPYLSDGPKEFWGRWHITLSRWIRDYVYIPLGGSRRGEGRTYVNLLLAFVASGVWHGAGWTFVLFGLCHGCAVAADTWLARRYTRSAYWAWLRMTVTFMIVVLIWPTFRSTGMSNLMEVYGRLGLFGDAPDWTVRPNGTFVTCLLMSAALHWSPKRWDRSLQHMFASAPAWQQGCITLAVALLVAWFGGRAHTPYIYFQF